MVRRFSKKSLEILLEETPQFRSPKRELEQYVTPSDIAAELLWEAFMKGDLEGTVYDLGCGTGKLAYGSLLLGAKGVVCVDIDYEALHQAKEFLSKVWKSPNVDFIQADVRGEDFSRPPKNCVVVMNPPFGVWSRGADIDFILKAAHLCRKGYSIHKASEGFKDVLDELVVDGLLTSYRILDKVKLRLGMTMEAHTRKSYYVDAYLLTFNSGGI
ncbi:MAG: methyltransferase [Desulfurococcales archaeon]|nr:methyltransferase [Desulfurococcales archaeon]